MPITQLQTGRLELAEHQRNLHVAIPEHAVKFEELANPAYWAHVAARLRIGDRIEVMPEDGSYFAELIVQDAGKQFAKVAVLRHVKLEAIEVRGEDLSAEYEVKWMGPAKKWRVMRRKDRSELRDGFATSDDATQWLRQHVRTVGAPAVAKSA